MASTSIRVSEALALASKTESRLMHRSQAGQIEYWARIGRAVEHSGQFDYAQITRALQAEIPVDALSAYEKSVYDELHDEAMRDATVSEQDAHRRRLQAMQAEGIDTRALGD